MYFYIYIYISIYVNNNKYTRIYIYKDLPGKSFCWKFQPVFAMSKTKANVNPVLNIRYVLSLFNSGRFRSFSWCAVRSSRRQAMGRVDRIIMGSGLKLLYRLVKIFSWLRFLRATTFISFMKMSANPRNCPKYTWKFWKWYTKNSLS